MFLMEIALPISFIGTCIYSKLAKKHEMPRLMEPFEAQKNCLL